MIADETRLPRSLVFVFSVVFCSFCFQCLRTLSAEITAGNISPLSGLPGSEGSHVRRIKSLQSNSFLILGTPEADPKWGIAGGRSYSSAMPYVPDREVALLFGHGKHGNVKKNGHFQDDLWAYDIMGHRWICLYPGTDIRKINLTVNADGVEVNKQGQHVPVAQAVHAWEQITYDVDSKSFMFIPSVTQSWRELNFAYTEHKEPAREFIKRRNAWMEKSPVPGTLYRKYMPLPAPWVLDLGTMKWELKVVKKGKKPNLTTGCGAAFMYIPGKNKCFYRRSNNAWLYDTGKNTWQNMKAKGPKPPFGIAPVACCDTKRGRVYLASGKYPMVPQLWYYDLQTNSWVDPKPENRPVKGMKHYSSNNAVMSYDSANDKVIVALHRIDSEKNTIGVYCYDPKANSWTPRPIPFPAKVSSQFKQKNATNGFYSSRLNAHFFHTAGDSTENGFIWVYRHGQGQKQGDKK
jgi:hypothetical protein